MSDVARTGAARWRRERRLRSWWKHEQQSVKAAVRSTKPHGDRRRPLRRRRQGSRRTLAYGHRRPCLRGRGRSLLTSRVWRLSARMIVVRRRWPRRRWRMRGATPSMPSLSSSSWSGRCSSPRNKSGLGWLRSGCGRGGRSMRRSRTWRLARGRGRRKGRGNFFALLHVLAWLTMDTSSCLGPGGFLGRIPHFSP